MNIPSFIFQKDDCMSKTEGTGTEIRLLAKADNVEVHKQKILAKRPFWLDSVDEWRGFEFLYLLEGQLNYLDSEPHIVLKPGDYIARHLIPERSHFETLTNAIILYVSSQPAYKMISEETKDLVNLAKEIERDEYTNGHCDRILYFAHLLGEWIGIPSENYVNLRHAAFFHDLGKSKVSLEILRKPSKLNDEEWAIMEQHTVWGREMLGTKDFLQEAGRIVEQTHERVDGTGYPKGLKNDEICLEAKIISVVDAYDAMTTDRPYRKGMPQEEALSRLQESSGTQFDPKVVEAFIHMLEQEGLKLPEFGEEFTHLKRHAAFLKLGEEILSDTDIKQILDHVVEAIVAHTPFARAALSLYKKPISMTSTEVVEIEHVVCKGLTPAQQTRLSDNPLPADERVKIFDEKFRLSRSYYIPHDQFPWTEHPGLVPGEQNNVSAEGTWNPDDFLCIPMRMGEQLIGLVSVDGPDDGQAPTPEVLEPIEIFANFAALAIERTRQTATLQATLQERDWFNHFLKELNQAKELEPLLNLIIERGIELLGDKANAGSFLVWNDVERRFEFRAAVNRNLARMTKLSLTREWISKNLFQTCRPVLLTQSEQLEKRPVRAFSEKINDDPPLSTIAVPIQGRDRRPIAIFNVNNLDEEGAFSEADAQKLWTLVPEIEVALNRIRDREQLQEQAIHDPLTRVYNRHYLSNMVGRTQNGKQHAKQPTALIMIDFIGFYKINDRFGHLQGDKVLRKAAAIFTDSVRRSDAVVRYGGDEFLIVLPDTTRTSAEDICERIHAQLKEHDWRLPIDVAIRTGISVWDPQSSKHFDEVLEEADVWMYRCNREAKV